MCSSVSQVKYEAAMELGIEVNKIYVVSKEEKLVMADHLYSLMSANQLMEGNQWQFHTTVHVPTESGQEFVLDSKSPAQPIEHWVASMKNGDSSYKRVYLPNENQEPSLDKLLRPLPPKKQNLEEWD